MDIERVRVLGNILNSTFGESSTVKSPTMAITGKLSGDTMTVSYTTIVYIASERNLRDQLKKVEDESMQMTNDFAKKCKSEFKSVMGSGLKLKELDTRDSVEIITTSPYIPRKTAYYRRFTAYKVE